MENDLVTIITPSYNTAKFIKETIQSVLNQSYKNWEMIIIDDCSQDDTKQIISLYNDDRIKFYINDRNSGAAISRNNAISIAKGKWIAFLDSDDLWDKDKLALQVSFMKENNYHFSYTDYREIDETGKIINPRIAGPSKISKLLMFCYCWPGCLTVMYDAEYVGKIQINNLEKNNDYAMWLKVIKKCNCYRLNDCLGSYRKRNGSISNISKIKLIKFHYRLFRYGENFNTLYSFLFTINNIFFGLVKKIKYK